MAKMTIDTLKAKTAAYVTAAKQAGTWTASTDNFLGLVDKVGKQITIDGNFQDKLPEMNGDDLPLGKTIEEWFIDLTLPSDYDATGANTMAPHMPTVEDCAYNYSLGRKVIATTQRYDNVERAAITAEDAGNMMAKIIQRLYDSQSLYTYAQKKQLLANVIAKASTSGSPLVANVELPVDTLSAEAFIKQVKADVEEASFASENTSLGKTLIGAAPELVLYVKKGVMPTVEVDALAGAFQENKLAIPAKVVVVDDFGNDNSGAFAVLADPRGIKLHNDYRAIREQLNAEGDFINFFLHTEYTGFISKNSYVKVYKPQA